MEKSVRDFLFILMSVSMIALSGCNNDSCDAVKDEVLEPATDVQEILLTLKDGNDVKSACPTILEQFRNFPNGAQTIRDIAANQFANSYSTCLDWNTITRWEYSCSEDAFHSNCEAHPDNYRYCAAYEHHSGDEPGYIQAVTLSGEVDAAYAKANEMCGDAENGKLEASFGASRELLTELNSTIAPQADQVYGTACN